MRQDVLPVATHPLTSAGLAPTRPSITTNPHGQGTILRPNNFVVSLTPWDSVRLALTKEGVQRVRTHSSNGCCRAWRIGGSFVGPSGFTTAGVGKLNGGGRPDARPLSDSLPSNLLVSEVVLEAGGNAFPGAFASPPPLTTVPMRITTGRHATNPLVLARYVTLEADGTSLLLQREGDHLT